MFKNVEMENFGVFKSKQKLNLADCGRVLIDAQNNDTSSADSNGSGKSTIFKAISWALFGKTIDGLSNTQVITSSGKPGVEYIASAKVGFKVDGVEYQVQRKQGKNSKLTLLEMVGSTFENRTQGIRETQASIVKLLGMDWDAFRCVCLFGQGDTSRFASPGMTDASRKAVLKQVLSLSRYEEAREQARALRGALTAEQSVATDRRRKIDVQVDSEQRVIELRSMDLEVAVEAVGNVEAMVEACKKKLKIANKNAPKDKRGRYLTVGAEYKEELQEIDEIIETAEAKLRGSEHDLSDAKREKRSLADSVCPTCKRPMDVDTDHIAKSHAELDKKISKASKKIEKYQSVVDDQKSERKDLKATIAMIEKAVSDAEYELKSHAREIEHLQNEVDSIAARAAEDEEHAKKLSDDIKKSKAVIKTLKVERKEVEDEIAVFAPKIAAIDWWVNGFGPKGVQAYAIEQALPALNAATNTHLLALSDGDLQICWSATATGTSGTEKEELTCVATVEGVVGAAPSGGQWRKIELATEIALAEIVRESGGPKTNLLLLDEALDGLDEQGSARVCSWFDTLDYDSIFVISHSSGISESFDQVIRVVKKDRESTIEV
jgi:DNA repair exonuclease SbcCD ATPase subunit